MQLSKIIIYPVKSLGGISIESSMIEERGLKFDRRWMLVDETNKFLTQREFPKMATVKVELTKENLRVSNGSSERKISFAPETNETARVKIWSSHCRAQIYDDETNEWFSDVLQTKCRLALMPEGTRRKVSYFYAAHKSDVVSFADGYPFLITGEGSLDDLNARLETAVPMDRFRPNLVVSGSEPFAEDVWKLIRVGDAVFHVVKPCGRCVITTIDQKRGEKRGNEPLKTLAKFRIPKRSIKKKILFGQNLIAENVGATVKVGDKIEVLEFSNKKLVFSV